MVNNNNLFKEARKLGLFEKTNSDKDLEEKLEKLTEQIKNLQTEITKTIDTTFNGVFSLMKDNKYQHALKITKFVVDLKTLADVLEKHTFLLSKNEALLVVEMMMEHPGEYQGSIKTKKDGGALCLFDCANIEEFEQNLLEFLTEIENNKQNGN